MKLGAIDVGTNSSRLLIVDVNSGGEYEVLQRDLITTRLGEGVDCHGLLKQSAIERVVAAINKFKRQLDLFGVKEDKVGIVGTSALRDVENSEQLISEIRQKIGYNLQVIAGSEEARLVYEGVSVDFPTDNFLIIDIGGGSTEFVFKEEGKIIFESLNIGAVRMTERFIKNPEQPLETDEYEKIYSFVIKLLEENMLKDKITMEEIAGVGGTITSLAAMDLKLEKYDSNKIHKYELSYKLVDDFLTKLANNNLDYRQRIKGLSPERADIITAGTIILKVIMGYFDLKHIVVSEHDILFGIIKDKNQE